MDINTKKHSHLPGCRSGWPCPDPTVSCPFMGSHSNDFQRWFALLFLSWACVNAVCCKSSWLGAGWKNWGHLLGCRNSRIPMPNWEQLLDRPIPAAGETLFGCEYSVVSILVGCEEEDGAAHAVHGCESAVCVDGVLVHICNSWWRTWSPTLISRLGNMDLGQEEHHQPTECGCLYHLFVEPTNSPHFLLSQPCFCFPSSPSGQDYHTSS